ncbi:DUF4232 domain-containing protein [Arthrobacter zhaoxinii]|uniref:DUF4232 domain-containing protein n=1 Tax=Arthrobacter zhaoxinii TaxID=2964616 RepID=UPI00210694CD|nr:DUF4232 domain-containing protein [Arthrobacter zhaoxinii]MCQ2002113.1 DUF4232 domain-containing protein [Arthrobacter zhaoxinii]
MITLVPGSTSPKTSLSRKALALTALLALSGSVLAGCGSRDEEDAAVSTSASPAVSSPASPSVSAGDSATPPAAESAAPSASPEAAPAPSPAATDGGTTAAGPCTADMLSGTVESVAGGAGADGISRVLMLTNVSADGTCTVSGYPGVSYLDAAGQQVGAPAARTEGAGALPVTLAPGQSAAAELRETVAQKYGGCQVQETASLLVYPPEDTASLTVPYPSTGCSNADIELLQVGTLQAR